MGFRHGAVSFLSRSRAQDMKAFPVLLVVAIQSD